MAMNILSWLSYLLQDKFFLQKYESNIPAIAKQNKQPKC